MPVCKATASRPPRSEHARMPPARAGMSIRIDETRLLERITTDPGIFGGKPIIRGRRLAVEHVLGMLGAGDSFETFLRTTTGSSAKISWPACCSPGTLSRSHTAPASAALGPRIPCRQGLRRAGDRSRSAPRRHRSPGGASGSLTGPGMRPGLVGPCRGPRSRSDGHSVSRPGLRARSLRGHPRHRSPARFAAAYFRAPLSLSTRRIAS